MSNNRAACQYLFKLFQNFRGSQYGFRSKSQATHVVQKAFNCLQYNQLFVKMKHLGFAKSSVNWFRNYLFGRKQLTEVNGCLSDKQDMLLGVPHGSILGLILFLIYINDINRSTDICHFTKFADDTTMLTTGETLEHAVDQMNKALA